MLGLYADAAEAGGSFRFVDKPKPVDRGRRGEARDPERSAEQAARRAGTTIRRYAAANRLNRLGTLTYAVACDDQEQLRDGIA